MRFKTEEARRKLAELTDMLGGMYKTEIEVIYNIGRIGFEILDVRQSKVIYYYAISDGCGNCYELEVEKLSYGYELMCVTG